MLNHCLNRRPTAQGQYPLKLGDINSYIITQEAYCLWEVAGKKKYSGVTTTTRYAQKTISFHLQNLAARYCCSKEQLLKYASTDHFHKCYYKIVNQQRERKVCLP